MQELSKIKPRYSSISVFAVDMIIDLFVIIYY
jgi:hypothetical protein